jgi:hypothetical protein
MDGATLFVVKKKEGIQRYKNGIVWPLGHGGVRVGFGIESMEHHLVITWNGENISHSNDDDATSLRDLFSYYIPDSQMVGELWICSSAKGMACDKEKEGMQQAWEWINCYRPWCLARGFWHLHTDLLNYSLSILKRMRLKGPRNQLILNFIKFTKNSTTYISID